MKKRSLGGAESSTVQPPEWDPKTKEDWFFEFQKEPVNDDKWSCIVTAAVQNEVQDEECIQAYVQCVNSGLRRAVKIISMSDVVKLLKNNNNGGSKKEEKNLKNPRKSPAKARGQRFTPVLELAARYATFTEAECRLPPELMAAVLKCMVLSLKEESCLRKRIDAVRERKTREQRIRAKFLRDLKPYSADNEEEENNRSMKDLSNVLDLAEPINDEPIAGPDLYVLLTDFYNPLYFPEFQGMKVPFVAVLRISTEPKSEKGVQSETDLEAARPSVAAFWDKLYEEYYVLANTSKFKDIVVVDYEAPVRNENLREYYEVVFNELTWTQYSVYCIYIQHRRYLQQLHVQRIILSLETLDLSKCNVYSLLCDALVSGEPITPLLVLYAMVEQVVAGVPSTESVALEYHPKSTDPFNLIPTPSHKQSNSSEEKFPRVIIATPCVECRNKKYESPCEKLKQQSDSHSQISGEEDWTEASEENSVSIQEEEDSSKSTEDSAETTSSTLKSLINRILTQRKTEKEIRESRRWKTPGLCFYGDSIYLQTYFCDPRLFERETVVRRFLKNSGLPLIWKKYPELSPLERAYYNFHFNTLLNLTKHREEALKLQIYFTLGMGLIGRTYDEREAGTEEQCECDKRVSSDMKLNQSLLSLLKGDEKNFRSYFLKTFIAGSYFRQMGVQTEDVVLGSSSNTETQVPSNRVSVTSQTPDSYGDFKQLDRTISTDEEQILMNFYSVLNCFHISNLADSEAPQTDDFCNIVQEFKFYEHLEPNFMIQRLAEAQGNFNAMHTAYFTPTDTLIVLLYNSFDGRGIFCASQPGVIHTPVGLRDFYQYVYPEITSWLLDEEIEHAKFLSELTEKAKEKEDKRDAELLAHLKRKYCSMSKDKRLENAAADMAKHTLQVKEEELGELPFKPRQSDPERVSFFVTNMADVRVETEGRLQEFYSQDGTQVRVAIDSWLYDPLQLLRMCIKRSNFSLYYNQWLRHTPTTKFTFKTDSDIIFSFCKDENSVTISWPTGLLIRPVSLGTGLYIKQTYIKAYRSGWEIEDEKSRCFLPNGQLLIFKSNGDYDILFGSGTKYSFCQATVPRYEITSTTGEVWQVRTKGPCKNKKTLMTTNKIFLGVDPSTKETFYKREDGTYCMLWPSGRLVTNYPDGTKLTTTPYFEKEEVITQWTDEEKMYYEKLESKHKLEQEPRSKTILRNSSTPRTTEDRSFQMEGFVLVGCTYLAEHPKYSSVCFNNEDPYVRLKMPDDITVLMSPEGNYEVRQERNVLKVDGTTVEFYKECPDCKEKTTAKLYLYSNDILCKCIDFFQQAFFVYRNGRTDFRKHYHEADFEGMAEFEEQQPEKSHMTLNKCGNAHMKSQSLMQRCFAFERDMRGVEFLHMGSLSSHFYQLPEETYFELNTEDNANICHTSNSPFYKIGYEKWVMDYEENNNSLPANLKKKDLKELGTKQVTRNTFKVPFPKHHNSENPQPNEKVKRIVNEPKVIVTRTLRCLSQNPNSVMEELRKIAGEYQEKAVEIFNEYRKHKVADNRTTDARYVEMRLRKIALTLSQSLHMYPHLCTNLPSTEKDIHYFGHFINSMETLTSHIEDGQDILPDCRQVPRRMPRTTEFSSIYEESESPRLT